jgi:hypothetical protein
MRGVLGNPVVSSESVHGEDLSGVERALVALHPTKGAWLPGQVALAKPPVLDLFTQCR